MNCCRFLISILLFFALNSKAQEFNQLSSAEIKLGLQKLNVVGNVLYIAAHPDDENTRLLAYLAKERKFRTGYLSITRGDGGQNLIGTEQAELLGIIRTQELLAARKVDGAEQYFTRANDFGFSKTAEESLRFWGKEQILEDVVWVIRNFKPDVIITRFPEDARAGHGQHAASAILAREAFFAAADPNRFPSQLNRVKPWQAKRIVWNTSNFSGANNTASADQIKINVGVYNPLLGKSYGEIAAQSRSNHKSQGFGSANQRGDFMEFFNHVAGIQAKSDLFEDIDFSWNKYKNGKSISSLINEVTRSYDFMDPSKSVDVLFKIKGLIDETGNTTKSAEIDALILACSGLWFELNTLEPQYALGDSISARLQAIARVPESFSHKISISESLSGQNVVLEPNKIISVNTKIIFPEPNTTQPYWLQSGHTIGSYQINDASKIGLPENKGPFSTEFLIRIDEQTIKISRPVIYKFTDPVRGEVYQHIAIAPPVTASLSDKSYIFKGIESKKVSVQLQAFRDNASGTLQVNVPSGWEISPKSISFNLQKGTTETKEFIVTPANKAESGNLAVSVKVGGQNYDQGIRKIDYEHIPAQTIFPKAEARLEKLDLKTSGKNIAYISGAGDLVAESLKQVGYKVSIFSAEQLANLNLANFDAIITGVRLYNINEEIKTIQPKLLEYVSKGGVLLVQYNVSNNLKVQNIGPFPFKLGRERVTQEDAEVTFLSPDHPALNTPNKITRKDFEGWVQERGLYFANEADKAYPPILSMNDIGEKPGSGSLLVTNYGKGKFVYTSLSFFRQLPAGVPGAYRLFVNLISK